MTIRTNAVLLSLLAAACSEPTGESELRSIALERELFESEGRDVGYSTEGTTLGDGTGGDDAETWTHGPDVGGSATTTTGGDGGDTWDGTSGPDVGVSITTTIGGDGGDTWDGTSGPDVGVSTTTLTAGATSGGDQGEDTWSSTTIGTTSGFDDGVFDDGGGTEGGTGGDIGDDDCPTDYDPVCTDDGTTYYNGCYAEAVEATIVHYGPCNPSEPEPPGEGEPPCEEDCPPSTCGDGEAAFDEECDDGNLDAYDGCSSECTIEESIVCGDGWLSWGEECDDWNTDDGDGCSSACLVEDPAECGNGLVEPDEQCDDGNLSDGDGCSSTCEEETCLAPGAGTPASPTEGPRRFCSTDTGDLHLDGFIVGPSACALPVETYQGSGGNCSTESPENMLADGGVVHEFADGKVEEWKVTLALKVSFSKIPVLGVLGPKYEGSFTGKHTVDTKLEVRLESGALPAVFVKNENTAQGEFMHAGTRVSARRMAESKSAGTIDNKFSLEFWVVEESVTRSDERYKAIRTMITYQPGEGDWGGAIKAKDILGRADLADNAPVRTGEVMEALRKAMNADAVRTKLEKEHAAALSAAGFVWGEKQIDYGCGIGPADDKGGLTEVCIVPWCHYDAIVGSKGFLGYGESVSYTTSGLFARKVEENKSYVIGNGSSDNPQKRILHIKNCSRYEVKKDTMAGLWSSYPGWEAGDWSPRGGGAGVTAPIMATGTKDCGKTGQKCFFTTRTLDTNNHQKVFEHQSNLRNDAKRASFHGP